MARLNGSTWIGKYSSGGTNYSRTFRAYAECTSIEHEDDRIHSILRLDDVGIEKISGGETTFVAGEESYAYIEFTYDGRVTGPLGGTKGGPVGNKFASSNPQILSYLSAKGIELRFAKGTTDKVITAHLYASKVAGAWSGTSDATFEFEVPALEPPTVAIDARRDETNETQIHVSVTATSFIGDVISSFEITVGGVTTTIAGGTIEGDTDLYDTASITRTYTQSNAPLGTVECSVVANGSSGASSRASKVLPSAFYTMDIGANGKEIAFGSSASGDAVSENGLFKCEMDVRFRGGMLADYVVERGVEGIWTWEKWASGKAIAWGKHTLGKYSWAAWGSYAIESSNSEYVNFPTALFLDNPIIECSMVDESGVLAGFAEIWKYDGTRCQIRAVRPKTSSNPSTPSFNAHIRLIGKWK